MRFYTRLRKTFYPMIKRHPKLQLKLRKKYWNARERWFESKSEKAPLNDKMIVFGSFMCRSFSCSPRALYEAMIADPRFDDWTFVWVFKSSRMKHYRLRDRYRFTEDGEEIPLDEGIELFHQHQRERYEEYLETDPERAEKINFDLLDVDAMHKLERAEVVRRGSAEYYKALAEAKFWVTNSRSLDPLVPREGQVYIQCWHGTPLKRMGHDMVANPEGALNSTESMMERYSLEASKWTYLVTPSPYATEHIMTAFGLDPNDEKDRSKVLEIGYPRNDQIVRACSDPDKLPQVKHELFAKNDIPEIPGKKYLLYAPTWRDGDYVPGEGWVQDTLIDFDLLREKLSDEWVILFRPHYFIASKFDFSQYGDFVVNAADVSDINDLYIIADALMTDYSSVFYDYACTHRPMLFYWPDFEEYAKDVRGFYMDPRTLPGPHCMTSQEVVDALLDFGNYDEKYGAGLEEFCKTFCPKEDGHAAERLADVVAKEAGIG